MLSASLWATTSAAGVNKEEFSDMKHAKKIELTFRREEGGNDVEIELRLEGDDWEEEFSLENTRDKGARFQMVIEAVRAALIAEDVPEYQEPTVAPGR